MAKPLQLLSPDYLAPYTQQCHVNWLAAFQNLRSKANFGVEDFEYYLIASSLYSSKIEGNTLDVNSFFRNRGNKNFPKKKEVQEVEDLVQAYKFASDNRLTKANFLVAHKLLSGTLLAAKQRGKIRTQAVSVRDSKTMRPAYVAVEPELVGEELEKLFADITLLLSRTITYKEVFYYASMIHLWVAMIHPFGDGNGRIARLTEKWFLAEKLGKAAWSVNSEKYYWDNRSAYYQNIALGFNYYALHWGRCVPFLLMLPEALRESIE